MKYEIGEKVIYKGMRATVISRGQDIRGNYAYSCMLSEDYVESNIPHFLLSKIEPIGYSTKKGDVYEI